MKVLGVIPARAGSKRIPNKNRQEVGGIELWEHALRFALESNVLDAVCVSTDDPEIFRRAGSHGLLRPANLGLDSTAMWQVLMHAAEQYRYPPEDAIMTLQPTSPFRIQAEADRCVFELEPANSTATCDASGKRDGGCYVTRIGTIWEKEIVFDQWTKLVRSEISLDINTPEDLERAREMWAKLHG